MNNLVKKISAITDSLAGLCFFSVMVLVVVNIILRKGFATAIIGAYELVGLLTATGIGLAQAKCTQDDGHIAVSILTDRFSDALQTVISIIVHIVSLGFWILLTWRMFVFGSTTFSRGMVSSTAQFPVYIFIFLLAFSLLCLCLVLMSGIVQSFARAVRKENK